MNIRSSVVVAIPAAALASASLTALLTAGPLDPPAGPVTSSYRTLSEVEPRIPLNAANTPGDAASVFRISQPGSYYLTQDLPGESGKVGIQIDASDVTVDLTGYTIRGVAGASIGIVCDADVSNITIRNGSITGFPAAITLRGSFFCKRHVVEDIHITSAGGQGIQLAPESVLRGCRVTGANTAINVDFGSLVDRCVVGFGFNGIIAAQGATITSCIVRSNTQNGISTQFGCTISNCTASANLVGILAGDGCTITDCSVSGSNAEGIVTGEGCTITGSSASGNGGFGISLGSGGRVADCNASNNFSGIVSDGSFHITGCTASSNGAEGFSLGAAGRIADCTAIGNAVSGIHVLGGAVVEGNSCVSNPASPGIVVQGADNRIQGNNCTTNGIGIQVVTPGNLIINNTCSGNSPNFTFAAGNRYGPIISLSVGGTPAVSGDSASSTVNSTDPWANFAY